MTSAEYIPESERPTYEGSIVERLMAAGELVTRKWEKYYDDDGNEFYYNIVSRKLKWDKGCCRSYVFAE